MKGRIVNQLEAVMRQNHTQADTVNTAIRLLDQGHRPGVVANWLRRRGVNFNVAWRVILAPEMRRAA